MFQQTLRALRPALATLQRGGRTLFSRRYLLYTNTAVAVFLSCSGDMVSQSYQLANKKLPCWDSTRTFHVSCTGFAVGPLFHYWYMFLDKWFPGKTFKIALKKIVLDQLICSPLFIATFLVTICLMENAPWKKIKSDLVEKGSTLYKAECLVWPPAQLVNFMFLSPKYRVLYDNGLSFFFDCYFSHVRFDNVKPHESNSLNQVTPETNGNVQAAVSFSEVGRTGPTQLCEHQLLLT